jgi:hypothetical protein
MNRRAFFASLAAIPFVARALNAIRPEPAFHPALHLSLVEFTDRVLGPQLKALAYSIDRQVIGGYWRQIQGHQGTLRLRKRGLKLIALPRIEVYT